MSGVDKIKLKEIVDATAAASNVYVSQAVGAPMLLAGLIEVNTGVLNPADQTEALCRSTPAAIEYLAASAEPDKVASNYTILKNVAIPAAKRRGNPSGNGAPTKYPFEKMEVNDTFFSANSEHKKGDAVKALGSTISSQNKKYSTQVMENGVPKTKPVTRAVRDKQTHKAVLNADGSKQVEHVELPVLEYSRKFTIRPVEKGVVYGGWTAPENGALIARIK